MTNDQHAQLIEFLGRKFDQIDRRFEGVDQRLEGIDQRLEEAKREREANRDEARRHATVLFEQSQTHLNLVAEGLGLRLDRVEQRLETLLA